MDSLQCSSVQENLDSKDDYHGRHLGPEDTVALSSLENPDRVRAWCKDRSEDYVARARALASVYNAVTPINRLPPEVLMIVFSYLEVSIETAVNCLLVCRMWTRVILRTHPFWVTALSSDVDLKHIEARRAKYEAFMSRTGILDLSLNTCGYTEDPATTQSLTSRARRIVRWNHSLRVVQEVDWLGALLTAGMPRLEWLWVCTRTMEDPFHWHRADPPERPERSGLLFSHPFDSHSFAHLRHISTPWDIFTPSNTLGALQHLLLDAPFVRESQDAAYITEKDLGKLLHALNQCPNLTLLVVRDELSVFEGGSAAALPVVELPHLAELSIKFSDYCPRFAYLLLSKLVYPSTTLVRVDMVRDPATGRPGPNWRVEVLSCCPAFRAAKALAFHVRPPEGTITIFSADPKVPLMEVSVTCEAYWYNLGDAKSWGSYTREFCHLLRVALSSLTSLTVYNPCFYMSDWKRVLESLPHLLELRSRGHDDEADLLPLMFPCVLSGSSWPTTRQGDSEGRHETLLVHQLQSFGFLWTYTAEYRGMRRTSEEEEAGVAEDEDDGEDEDYSEDEDDGEHEEDSDTQTRRSMHTLADTLSALLSVRAHSGASLRRLSVLVPHGDLVPAELQAYLQKRLQDLVEVVEVAHHFDAWSVPCTAPRRVDVRNIPLTMSSSA